MKKMGSVKVKYEEIVKTIESKRRFGSLPGIEVSRMLLAAVGNPERDLVFVHIAGTNGKGSTAAFLQNICTCSGLKTGLFTSPHLVEFTERIQIDGRQIEKEAVTEIGQRLLALENSVSGTMFDYCMVMALLYFKEQKCDLVVLETGLGGRLDSTNAISVPLISILTKIGYDHTDILGNTLEQIAEEKCGILKEGTVLVSESQELPVQLVIKKKAHEKHISVQLVEEKKIRPQRGGYFYADTFYELRMLGAYQYENAQAAVLAANILKEKGYAVTQESIRQGLKKAVWPGRMEVISQNPLILMDGAHNSDGVTALKKSIELLFPERKFHVIMGVLADKDYEAMIQIMAPIIKDVVCMTVENKRALQAAQLVSLIQKKGIPAVSSTKSVEVVLRETREDTIVFGSLYFIGEIRKGITF